MIDQFIEEFVNEVVDAAANAADEAPRRRCLVRNNAFDLRDKAFVKNFRLPKQLVVGLIQLLDSVITATTTYNTETKVLCALHFFGHGSYQTPVGEHLTINMSQSSVSRCINEVVEALNHPTVFGQWVHFPNCFNEMNKIIREFYDMYGFPGIIGCIDCTHIAIVPPNSNVFDEKSYVNRKNYHSINTQLICDSHLNILNVNSLFPGSTHDCHIWHNSNVLSLMEQLHTNGHTNYHLIGDSGYPLRPWCLTPIAEASENTAEERYNKALKKARCTIERCNGVLKGRFRCLIKDRVLHYTPNKATKIINACTVLHNMCIKHNVVEPTYTDLDEEQLGIVPVTAASSTMFESRSRVKMSLQQERAKQTRIIESYFI